MLRIAPQVDGVPVMRRIAPQGDGVPVILRIAIQGDGALRQRGIRLGVRVFGVSRKIRNS